MADRFWVGGTGSWDATTTHWSTISGGANGASAPTATDDAFIDANSGTGVINVSSAFCNNLDFTGYTGTFGLAGSALTVSGSLTLASGMVVGLGGLGSGVTFNSTSLGNTITTNGKDLKGGFTFNGTGSWLLQDTTTVAPNNTTGKVLHSNGTLDLNGQTINTFAFTSNGTNTRALKFGTGGTLNIKDSGNVFTASGSGLTVTAGTGIIKFTNITNTSIVFAGNSLSWPNIYFNRGASTASNTISGSNTFLDIKDDGTGTHSILFTAGTTQTFTTFTVSGTAGHLISLDSTTTATHSLVKAGGGVVSSDYLNIQHSVATPSNTWYAGANSIDNQATVTAGSGWIFTVPPPNTSTGFFNFM